MHKAQTVKQYAAALLTAGLLVSGSSLGHAAFSTVDSVTKSAGATLTGTGVVTMTVAAKNVSDNATVANIAWTGVTLPTSWKKADQYLELASNITAATGGIRIVTDNKDASAVPQYLGSTGTAAGLVDTTTRTNALQLAWSIKDTLTTPPAAAKPFDAVTDGAGTADQFQWLYMTDKTNDLAPGDPYRTAVNAAGIHFGGGATEFGAAASPNYVYLESDFTTAVTPRTYSTSKLIVEAFTQ